MERPLERLKQRADFLVAATGAKAPGAAFVLQARRRAETGPPRVGFTVSKKVGNAVVRNRVRRRLRDIVRLSAAASLRSGHDYVLIGRRAALEWPFERLMREFDGALRRVHAPPRQGTGRGTGDGRSKPLHETERRPPRR
jgi:ribonuclease P protein component